MKEFKKFYFKSFEFDKKSLIASFHYSFDNEVFFEEKIDFTSQGFRSRLELNDEVINNILFHLHIALGISYYKSFPTCDLIIESGFLDSFQIEFWKKFYINGLGEFLFVNKISIDGLFNFINASDLKYEKIDFFVENRALVPVGGGKDSIVSIEMLRKGGIDFDLFVFGKNDKLKEDTSILSGKNILLVKRYISSKLFELNNEGYYNGHVPITGLIAFVMEFTAYLYSYKHLVLSNEKSANFGNTIWNGLNINHQYSKSLEFEKDFKNYVEKYITKEIKYFSLLRGLYEIEIAKYFAKNAKKYFSSFSSCNNNFKIFNKSENIELGKRWCNKCSKCAFVFTILRPYLNEDEVIEIFGEDLFDKKILENTFRELLGITGIKPLECVGEAEEVIFSMYKTLDKYSNKLPFILGIFKNEVLSQLTKKDINLIEKKLGIRSDDDIIPEEIKKIIFKK